VDLDSGEVGQAFTLAGADMSIGPGLDGGMLDVGDGAAIYVVGHRPIRPADCADGPAMQSVPLPLPRGTDLCVLTGEGRVATLDVTTSSGTSVRFSYRLWSG
jgi:hypothetical protein